METKLEQLSCGECGEIRHNLYLRPNGEVVVECTKCKSQSEIIIPPTKIEIRNNAGYGTLTVF